MRRILCSYKRRNLTENWSSDNITWQDNTLAIKKDTELTGALTLPAGTSLVLNADLQICNYETGTGEGVGIAVAGDLIISGKGELTVDTESNAINVAGGLTAENITGHLTSRGGSAIYATGGVSLTGVSAIPTPM